MKLYQTRRERCWSAPLLFALCLPLVALLVSCGQAGGTPGSIEVPTPLPIPTSTLTLTDIDATKIAHIADEQQAVGEISTRTAMGTPWVFTPSPYRTFPPDPTPGLGFGSWCTDPDPYDIWRSCWTGVANDDYFLVYTGASRQEPTQGVLQVYSYTITSGVRSLSSPRQQYRTPTRSGVIRIIDLVDHTFALEAEGGAHFYFDLDSRQWVGSKPFPTPSP